MHCDILQVRKGDIYFAELSGTVGSEQSGTRPVLVIQNNVGNQHSPTTIVAAITSKYEKATLPTHITLEKHYGLPRRSIVLLEQIRTIDKQRLLNYIGTVDSETMREVEGGILVSFGIGGDTL